MRILGILVFLIGSAGTAYAVGASFAASRKRAALFGLLTPLCVLLALVGALLVFVPAFLS